jgi:hypothetical protein
VSEAAGRHAIALASVRELAARAGAQRVVLLVDEGDGAEATMIEWAGDGTLEVTEAGVTEPVAPAAIAQVTPAVLPDVVAVPPTALTVDADTGELAAPLGALAGLAEGVVALAAAFGGRSVATAEFPTRDPERPLALAARPGEPVVAQVGGEVFAFPEGWP